MDIITTNLELAKVAIKLDQPGKALDLYTKALIKFPNEIHLLLGISRIYDMLNDPNKSLQFYKKATIA
jgi:tetratricopeptide repeat protein 8